MTITVRWASFDSASMVVLVHLVAIFFMCRDEIKGDVADQADQKPGEADDYAYIADVRH